MPDLFYKKTKKEIKKYITSDQQIAWRNILNNFIKQLRLKKKGSSQCMDDERVQLSLHKRLGRGGDDFEVMGQSWSENLQ